MERNKISANEITANKVQAGGSIGAELVDINESDLASDQEISFILELREKNVTQWKKAHPRATLAEEAAYRTQLIDFQNKFLKRLRDDMNLQFEVGRSQVFIIHANGRTEDKIEPHQFTDSYHGMNLIGKGSVVQQLRTMVEIASISKNTDKVYVQLKDSVPHIHADEVYKLKDAQGQPIDGRGIEVSVNDTGVDYTHPALEGKVKEKSSLTGEPPIDNFGHGTHVACIIAANSAEMKGVAPGASISSIKVLDANGSGSLANVILSMEMAVKSPNVRIINLSLGGNGDANSPESAAADTAMERKVVVVAAGNAGPRRSTVGAPGAARRVITVGAVSTRSAKSHEGSLRINGACGDTFRLDLMDGSTALPATGLELKVIPCGLGRKGEFPANEKAYVALMQRGELTFSDKAKNAQEAGAGAVVIYNNDPDGGERFGRLAEDAAMITIPVISTSKQTGESIMKALNANKDAVVTVYFNPVAKPRPDELARFSSRGPNLPYRDIKPDLCAPGVDILAGTIKQAPQPGMGMADPSGQTRASGTSMAAPHIAGVAALMLQNNPNLTPLQVKAMMVQTSRFLANQGGFMDQGAGCVDALKAVTAQAYLLTTPEKYTSVSFPRIVNNGATKVTEADLLLERCDGKEPTYTVRFEAVGGKLPEGLTLQVSPTVTAQVIGEVQDSKTRAFKLTIRADGAKVPNGVYEGWVVAEENGETYRLPVHYEALRTLSDADELDDDVVNEWKENDNLPCC